MQKAATLKRNPKARKKPNPIRNQKVKPLPGKVQTQTQNPPPNPQSTTNAYIPRNEQKPRLLLILPPGAEARAGSSGLVCCGSSLVSAFSNLHKIYNPHKLIDAATNCLIITSTSELPVGACRPAFYGLCVLLSVHTVFRFSTVRV